MRKDWIQGGNQAAMKEMQGKEPTRRAQREVEISLELSNPQEVMGAGQANLITKAALGAHTKHRVATHNSLVQRWYQERKWPKVPGRDSGPRTSLCLSSVHGPEHYPMSAKGT